MTCLHLLDHGNELIESLPPAFVEPHFLVFPAAIHIAVDDECGVFRRVAVRLERNHRGERERIAGIIGRPGTRNGPCIAKCNHKDCDASRQQAASICWLCEKPVGFDTRFYAADGGFVHALCLEESEEAKP